MFLICLQVMPFFFFALSGLGCSSKGNSCHGRSESYHPEFGWNLTLSDVSEDHRVMDMARGSSQGWEEGKREREKKLLEC